MRISLFFWLLLFVAGVFVGDRYGAPGWARGLTDGGITAAERWFGRLGDPVPAAEDVESNEETTTDAADASRDEPASSELGHADNAGLRMNDAGLKIIKESEGLRLEAYNLGGQWLIGYGHSRTAKSGMTITEAQAEQLLREDVRASEDAVRRMVLVPVNQNQFSAMVSLAYNMGSGGFSRSTVLDALNKGNYNKAADNFRNHNKGGGKVIPHLSERREKERELFLSPA